MCCLMRMCRHHGKHMEVRGQLVKVSPLFTVCGSQGSRFGSKGLTHWAIPLAPYFLQIWLCYPRIKGQIICPSSPRASGNHSAGHTLPHSCPLEWPPCAFLWHRGSLFLYKPHLHQSKPLAAFSSYSAWKKARVDNGRKARRKEDGRKERSWTARHMKWTEVPGWMEDRLLQLSAHKQVNPSCQLAPEDQIAFLIKTSMSDASHSGSHFSVWISNPP